MMRGGAWFGMSGGQFVWVGEGTSCGARRLRGGEHTLAGTQSHTIWLGRVSGWMRPPPSTSKVLVTHFHTHLGAGSEGH